MLSAHNQDELKLQPRPVWSILAYVVAICIAVDAALLISVAGKLSWSYSAVMAFSAAILAVGLVFTALEVVRSARPRRF